MSTQRSLRELTVEVADGKAQAKLATGEDAGPACALDFDSLRLKTIGIFLERLAAGGIQKRKELETLGEHLYAGLLTGDVRTFVERYLRDASARNRLKLRLKLPDVTEAAPGGLDAQLAAFPWEYLWCPSLQNGFFLTTRVHLLLSRYMPLGQAEEEPAAAADVLTIGVVFANPDDPQLAPAAGHEVIEALRALDEGRNEIVVDVLEHPTPPRVISWMSELSPQVLHFIGHGGYDDDEKYARIMLVGDDGFSREVGDTELATFFRQADCWPSVVVLHLAEGGSDDVEQNLARLAPALIREGVPAVVAMQHPFPVDAAKHFSTAFYRELANCEPIDVAVTSARVEYLNNVPGAYDNRAFGTPVLYARAYSRVVSRPLLGKHRDREDGETGRVADRDVGARRGVSPSGKARREAGSESPETIEGALASSSELPQRSPGNGDGGERPNEVEALVRAIVETGRRTMGKASPPLEFKQKAVVYGWFKQLDTQFAAAESTDQLADPIHYEWVEEQEDSQLRAIAEAMERTARGQVGDD
jgi:CHAT domain